MADKMMEGVTEQQLMDLFIRCGLLTVKEAQIWLMIKELPDDILIRIEEGE